MAILPYNPTPVYGTPYTLASVQSFLQVSSGTDDTLIEGLMDAAWKLATNYLNRSFYNTYTQLLLDTVVAGDAVEVEGLTFEAGAAKDAENRIFAVGLSDAATATNLCELLMDSIYGVPNVGATNLDNTATPTAQEEITLSYLVPNGEQVSASSSSDNITVVSSAIFEEIPAPIVAWCMSMVALFYEKRANGITNLNMQNIGTVAYGAIDYTLLQPYRKYQYTS